MHKLEKILFNISFARDDKLRNCTRKNKVLFEQLNNILVNSG